MEVVKDRDDREYVLADILAEGGEGRVMRTDSPRVLVKLRTDGTRRLDEVLRADLEDLAVTPPYALLAPPASGYVMHLVADAEPLEVLLRPAGLSNEAVGSWYASTGGARRRLRALGGLASTMASLHARGLCVADVSPRNVLIPVGASEHTAWLIDPDNLHEPDAVSVSLYTRPYVAPEVHRGEAPCSMRSDVYCLALIALEILTLWFALFGEEIRLGDPQLEEPALDGQLPWIHDRDDRSNAAPGAPPAEFMLGAALDALARRALEAGRTNPAARPSAAAWAGALQREADRCTRCTARDCGAWCPAHWTQCMACGRPLAQPAVVVRIADSDPRWPEQLAVPEAQERLLRRCFASGKVGPQDSKPELLVKVGVQGLRLEHVGLGTCEVEPGGWLLPGLPLTIPRGTPAELTFDGKRAAKVIWA